jgi:DNA helicase HerA-like ATPase
MSAKKESFKFGGIEIDVLELASRGNAVLGIRDSGKTYTATALAEKLMSNGVPIIVFDPVGVWRFLRVPGAGRGYPVVVAGGMAGDLPLTVGLSAGASTVHGYIADLANYGIIETADERITELERSLAAPEAPEIEIVKAWRKGGDEDEVILTDSEIEKFGDWLAEHHEDEPEQYDDQF